MKFIYRFVNGLRKIYWYIFRPQTYGVKCLIGCENKFLLIRNSYGSTLWNIPGGGLKSSEDTVEAVKREVFEELGLVLDGADYLGEYISTLEYHKDTVYCFYVVASTEVLHLNAEIKEARWFDKNNLPKEISQSIKQCLAFLKLKTTP